MRRFLKTGLQRRSVSPCGAAFAEAQTVSDTAANEKLAKAGEGMKRRRGRDDLAAAIVLAVAEGMRREANKPRPRFRYRGAA